MIENNEIQDSTEVATRPLFQERELTDPDFAIFGVERILQQAYENRASDIHLIPLRGKYSVNLRVDGAFRTLTELTLEQGQCLLARMKVLGRMKTFVTTAPQEGRISLTLGALELEARISTFPTVSGEKGVVRIFSSQKGIMELEDLQFSAPVMNWLRERALSNQGVVLICGPSGSGKTTALYALLSHIHRLRGEYSSIVTLEDPVERVTGLFAQTQINGDMNFHKGLTGLLRQDPEVIMIGEIRDPETASVAFEAGLTGHLILSTLHCDDPAGALARLRGLSIARGVLDNGLRGVLCLRLLRRLCHCREEGSPGEMSRFAPVWASRQWSLPQRHWTRGHGCPRCGGTGYYGRVPAAAALNLTGHSDDITFGKEIQGLLDQGLTDFTEVLRIFPGGNFPGEEIQS